MANVLEFSPREGSSFGIKAEFFEVTTDEEPGLPIVPNEGLSWSLTDDDGNIVNGRNKVPLVPASSVMILLQGDDLRLTKNYPAKRFLTVEGTYDSIFGDGILLVDEVSFQITNLKGIQ